MKVPADSLIALPEELSFRAGAAISCGTGTAWGGLDRLALRGNETIAVFGQGPVGLSATQLASAMGGRVIAIDVDEDRLARATQFGADAVIHGGQDDVVNAIHELTGGRGVECAMDCSGVEAARVQAIQSTGKWGRVAFVGEGGRVSIDVSNDMNRKQLTVMGCWTFSKNGQAECARFVTSRRIDVDSLFTHAWPLEQAQEAYNLFDTQSTGKGVLLPG
jgi:Threonine dehydrogenase and related Zn-dependent dehydrogenases